MPGILPLKAEARDQKSKIILDRLVISGQSKLQETFSQGIIKKEKYITQAVIKQYNIDTDNITKTVQL